MKRYVPYAKRYWYWFLLAPFTMALEASGEFILPYLNANVINKGVANGDIDYIVTNGIYMLILAIFMIITGCLAAVFAIRGASNMASDLRNDTFKKIQKFSFTEIDRFTTGSLITRITNDITQIQIFTQTMLRGMFRCPVMLVGAIIMSITLNSSLAAIILAVIPVLAISIFVIVKISSPRYTIMQNQLDTLNTEIGESVTNERVIKSFVREEYQKEKFKNTNELLYKKTTSALKVMQFLGPISSLCVNVTTLLVVYFAGHQINVGGMEIGTLTAFITYLTQILTSLNMVAMFILSGTRASASSKRIGEVLDCDIILNDDNSKHKEKQIEKGDIEFKNVNFRYFKHNTERVLQDINFNIGGGEFVGVIGSTGCGKSTLISFIPRLYDPDSGTISVDGIDVRDYSLKSLRDGISVVLQKNTLFSGTIAENMRWGNEDATDEELRAAAKIASADAFITSFKDGYETEIGQGGTTLSGGQKQRICIARALLKKPKILILDDSTSAVDTATDAAIRMAFREKLPSVTKIVIAQRINSVIDADKIIVLDAGRVTAIGTHAELMKTSETYKEIYLSQKEIEGEVG